MTESREQKLIDIMFEIALVSAQRFHGKSNEEICAWVADQLHKCGFPTIPVGSGWGHLITEHNPNLVVCSGAGGCSSLHCTHRVPHFIHPGQDCTKHSCRYTSHSASGVFSGAYFCTPVIKEGKHD